MEAMAWDAIEEARDAGLLNRLGTTVPRRIEPEMLCSHDPYERHGRDGEAAGAAGGMRS